MEVLGTNGEEEYMPWYDDANGDTSLQTTRPQAYAPSSNSKSPVEKLDSSPKQRNKDFIYFNNSMYKFPIQF